MASRSPRVGFESLGGDALAQNGRVIVTGCLTRILAVGEFADVVVTGASEYDLKAKLAS